MVCIEVFVSTYKHNASPPFRKKRTNCKPSCFIRELRPVLYLSTYPYPHINITQIPKQTVKLESLLSLFGILAHSAQVKIFIYKYNITLEINSPINGKGFQLRGGPIIFDELLRFTYNYPIDIINFELLR